MGWSAICECGISWYYSITFCNLPGSFTLISQFSDFYQWYIMITCNLHLDLNIDLILIIYINSIAIFHTSSGKAGTKAGVVSSIAGIGFLRLQIKHRSTEPAWFMPKYRMLHRSSMKDFPCMLNSFNFHFSLLTITL